MLLYNWNKVFKDANGSVNDVVLIFKMLTKGLVPYNTYDKLYKFYLKDYSGKSYVLHPDVLLYNLYKYTNIEAAQYIALASLRPLAEYYASGEVTLDLFHNPIDRSLFINNRLLRVEDEKLHFLFEEVPTEKH
jgi:hypothetical protein